MARATKAQKIEIENEQAALQFFEFMLAGLTDPRRPQGLRYPLRSVVVIALVSMVCSCDNAESMELWGELNEEWLGEILELPHGGPSQDVYLSVFASLNPSAFSEVFRAWSAWVALKLGKKNSHIAIDGKNSRRTKDVANGIPALHTVIAWSSDSGLVLAQCKTTKKSNEIAAITELLAIFDLHGETVAIDAVGCQREIARPIVDSGGNYLLAAKENQPTLHQEIVETSDDIDDDRARSLEEESKPEFENFIEIDKGHGRIETRSLRLCKDLRWILSAPKWVSLSCVIEVRRERIHISMVKTSSELPTTSAARKLSKPKKQHVSFEDTGALKTSCTGCSTWHFEKTKLVTGQRSQPKT
ncbi:MAG: ISAs1 family transposase [Myxococcales bacterium]|nr:ISAs1 family transposase [Myxococcales bacterium]